MLLDEIQKIAAAIPAEMIAKKGVYTLRAVIAERKAFLTTKKLTYQAKIKIDETAKEVHFTEMLKEAGAGLSAGGDLDMGPGIGFKAETYNTMSGARQGTIQEQSNLFGKKYEYKFSYEKLRNDIQAQVEKFGYKFVYTIF